LWRGSPETGSTSNNVRPPQVTGFNCTAAHPLSLGGFGNFGEDCSITMAFGLRNPGPAATKIALIAAAFWAVCRLVRWVRRK